MPDQYQAVRVVKYTRAYRRTTSLQNTNVTTAASVEDGGFGRIVDLCLSLGSILVG